MESRNERVNCRLATSMLEIKLALAMLFWNFDASGKRRLYTSAHKSFTLSSSRVVTWVIKMIKIVLTAIEFDEQRLLGSTIGSSITIGSLVPTVIGSNGV
jgi:hypothetical protein